MKKLVMMVVMMLVMVMGGMPVHAAEEHKDNYEIVKAGIEADIEEAKKIEDEDERIISVERKEFPSEKVMMYEIEGISDGDVVKVFIYINGESEEVYAVSHDSNGDVIDYEIMNLSEAAELYAE